MSVSERLRSYLTEQGVEYETRDHHVAFTAQEVAASEHVSGKTFAKVVIAFADGRMVMLVLPAANLVDLGRAARALGAAKVRLATENEFSHRFPDCELGAMPPFGNLYDVPVYVDPTLADREQIVFQAGTHSTTVSMRYPDFERLVRPAVAEFRRDE